MSDQPLSPSRQVIFHQMLVASRKTVLIDAMSEALASINPVIVKEQILRFVPAAAQKTLAASGIRDEHVFPVPIVLEKKTYAHWLLPIVVRYLTETFLPQWHWNESIQEHGDARDHQHKKSS